MPVEATRVKGELRKLFPKVNLTTKRLDEISARLAKKAADDADDAAITQLINDANEFMPFAEIAKDDDRFQTLKKQSKKGKSDDDKGDDDRTLPNPDEDSDEPAWIKKLDARFDTLLKEVDQLKQDKVITSKREEARTLFKNNATFKELPEKAQNHYLDQLNYKDDGKPLEDQVTGLEEIVKEIVQVKADSTEIPGGPPKGANHQAGMSKEAMDKILKDIKA